MYVSIDFGRTMQKPEPASRIDRLVAIIVDAFVVMILCVPVFYYTGIDDIAEIPRTASMSENNTTRSLIFATVFMVINIYFLRTDGQTIGKRGRKITIVNNDGTNIIAIEDSWGGTPTFDYSNSWSDGVNSNSWSQESVAVEEQEDGTFKLAVKNTNILKQKIKNYL